MAFTGLAFAGFATFPRWHEERDPRTGSDIDVKGFPSRSLSEAITFLLALASLLLWCLLCGSTLLQHQLLAPFRPCRKGSLLVTWELQLQCLFGFLSRW
jgi:hypothetical protein